MELVETLEINGEEREIADAYARGQIAANAQNIATNAEGIAGLNNNLTDLNKLTGDKSILFNQLIPLLSSSNWVAEENVSVSFENNVATVTNTIKNFGIKTISKVEQIEQNMYYLSFELKTTSKLKVVFGWGEAKATKISAYEDTGGVFKRFYALIKSYINSNSVVYIWAPEGIGTFSVKNAKIVNLTKMFGAGKEPTVKEFENLFPNDYYEKTNGIPISNIGIASSIERINDSLDVLKSDLSTQSKVVEKHDKIINTPNVATVSGMSYDAEADEIVLNSRLEPDETIADRVSWHDNALNGIYDTMTALKGKTDSELGGLSFSASGTTLTITDGTNTWTLTAN